MAGGCGLRFQRADCAGCGSPGMSLTECPNCGGEIYDNSAKPFNAQGKRRPLYKCKDDSCGWVKWPPKEQRAGGKPGAAANGPAGPKWTWGQISGLFGKSLKIAAKHLKE